MDIAAEARNYACSEMQKCGLPTVALFELSEKKALELAEKLSADTMVVQAGHALMDIKLGQAFTENRLPEHIQMGVEAARSFLKQFELGEETQQKIINCIEAHHGTVPFTCIEAEICANADCYRFIHPRGFFIYLTGLSRKNENIAECLQAAEKKMDEKYRILSLDICKGELGEVYRILKQLITEARNA